MGEAKRRKAWAEQFAEQIRIADLPRVSSALRRLATAASLQRGGDCYVHAALGQAILAKLGIKSDLAAGWSAWRCGSQSDCVMLHAPLPDMPSQPGAVAFHVWLVLENKYILDFTTYSIVNKFIKLDQMDGGKTVVEWAPEYLYEPLSRMSTLGQVIQGEAGGLFYYERNEALQEKIISAAEPLDQDDLEIAWTLYQNPDMVVFGPNDVMRSEGKV